MRVSIMTKLASAVIRVMLAALVGVGLGKADSVVRPDSAMLTRPAGVHQAHDEGRMHERLAAKRGTAFSSFGTAKPVIASGHSAVPQSAFNPSSRLGLKAD